MQSTGHSSMHALSSTSTQGSAITYVTAVLRRLSFLRQVGCVGAAWPTPSMPFVVEPSWLGRRITVRRAVGRDADGRLQFADVVGDLVDLDATHAVVDARNGEVRVELAHVVTARQVVPSTAEILDLQRTAAGGLRAAETERLDGWLLRADGGFTRRANSILPLGQLARPVPDALAAAQQWYAARGLPALFQVPLE